MTKLQFFNFIVLLLTIGVSNSIFSQTWTTNGSKIYYNDGNVGIGHTNPGDKIHLHTSSGSIYARIQSLTDNQSAIKFMTANHNWVTGLHGGEDGKFKISYNTGFGNNDFFTIRNNGNVGINTTNPNTKLHIDGVVRLNPGISNNNFLQIQSNNSSQVNMVFYIQNEAKWNLYTQGDGRLIFRKTNNNSDGGIKMVIDGDNVGIGTASPDSKLTVKGNIHAEEVKVDLSVPGPDYVFKDDYDLLTLEETQNYINEHGHLPNIPSAKEMKENGIELGIMNMKLLEKIEELILYTLTQEKQLKTQMKENTNLTIEIESLKAINSEIIKRLEKLEK